MATGHLWRPEGKDEDPISRRVMSSTRRGQVNTGSHKNHEELGDLWMTGDSERK